MKLYAGTSGFSYPKWKGAFYPKDAKTDALLEHYAKRLPSVEINNTFYRMPRESVVHGWKAQVPDDFRFSMKASRRITHYAKLKETADSVQFLLQALGPLETSLGVVLFQLPPQFQKSVEVLKAFLATLPSSPRVAMEFRHRSWFDDEVYALLSDAKVALVGGDGDDTLPPVVPTTDFGYLRLRSETYDTAALAEWHSKFEKTGWKHAFVYFKHEELGPLFAEQLLALAAGTAPKPLPLPKDAPAAALASQRKSSDPNAMTAKKGARPGLTKSATKPSRKIRQAK